MANKGFKKEEKLVLILGIVVLIVLLVLGIYKKQHTVVEHYEFKETSSSILQTKDLFKFEYGSDIPTNADYYLKDVKSEDWNVDLKNVNNKETGSYQITLSSKDIIKKISVKIVDTKAPVITLKNNNVEWQLSEREDVRDLAMYVDAQAFDELDGDITKYIVGWPKQLPEEEGSVQYTLRVRDKARNIAQEVLTVHFYR